VLVADGSANGADSDNPEALAFHSFINGKKSTKILRNALKEA